LLKLCRSFCDRHKLFDKFPKNGNRAAVANNPYAFPVGHKGHFGWRIGGTEQRQETQFLKLLQEIKESCLQEFGRCFGQKSLFHYYDADGRNWVPSVTLGTIERIVEGENPKKNPTIVDHIRAIPKSAGGAGTAQVHATPLVQSPSVRRSAGSISEATVASNKEAAANPANRQGVRFKFCDGCGNAFEGKEVRSATGDTAAGGSKYESVLVCRLCGFEPVDLTSEKDFRFLPGTSPGCVPDTSEIRTGKPRFPLDGKDFTEAREILQKLDVLKEKEAVPKSQFILGGANYRDRWRREDWSGTGILGRRSDVEPPPELQAFRLEANKLWESNTTLVRVNALTWPEAKHKLAVRRWRHWIANLREHPFDRSQVLYSKIQTQR
jgi:hypothetical protein